MTDAFRRSARIPLCGLGLLALAGCGDSTAPAATAAPPFSMDTVPLELRSAYGSGNFGRWDVDEFGLPVFHYRVDQARDPRAAQTELAGATQAQHALGNDNVKGMFWNDGYTTLWSQGRLSQWANQWNPQTGKWSGGYGYLYVDGAALSTLYLDRPSDAQGGRDFGLGYGRRWLRSRDLEVREELYAPFGDDPLLLHDVHITNQGNRTRRVSWFEYWDVNPVSQTEAPLNRGVAAPRWDAATRTLSVAQLPDIDLNPYSIFASALQGPVEGFETMQGAFFGQPASRQQPAAVLADHLGDSIAPPSPPLLPNQTVLVLRAPLLLAPGETVHLRYAYGMAHAADIAALVARYSEAEDPFSASEHAWAGWVPHADYGEEYRWVARELAWSAYLLRAATVREEVCGHHTITQGGYYQYDTGANLGYRSWLHYLLPITYTDPDLAREILRYSIRLQPPPPPALQTNPYGVGPLCLPLPIGVSIDLDFWLLLAASEYGLGMRDLAFFDEPIPYWDSPQTVSAWEHLKDAFAHQETLLGPHGGYLMLGTGDWTDFSTVLVGLSESMLVTAQLAYAYPQLADLAELRGDTEFASRLRSAAARNLETLRREWTGKGWYSRGYRLDQQVGQGVIFEEPQPWAILAGAPTAPQAATLVSNVRRFLTGVGAPGGPSPIGSAESPGRNDPDVTEHGLAAAQLLDAARPLLLQLPSLLGTIAQRTDSAVWPGDVWYDLNGHLAWALASLDGTVPDARDYAWDEYTRNTLAAHATAFPDHWAGTISVDDLCNAWYAHDPVRCGGYSKVYDGQVTEHPTWVVMNALNLAGVSATREGFRIAPHYPFRDFALALPRVGLERRGSRLRGYFRLEADTVVQLRVQLPDGVNSASVFVNGIPAAASITNGEASFPLPVRSGERVSWELQPGGAS